ncbi:hypothetical protein [Mucilaginibacter myungsuensis]|uniref:Uncharacterized protein n=1 Tax=Mucilaginibacter myungsuensis TaxID=649104 RepID=A0A929L699_9SPHI|nr:hypothetical protein [Mucilaginibacter myungsuensis]MBE9663976.1 hypothetical protein [Mucilaginibacter myungsuensis]MDN3601155.1 hypothetical protein [Mucilaginibacter myungsuensis]
MLLHQTASAQTLAATDGLGRVLPQQAEVGKPKPNKHIAIFYFLWQGDPTSPTSERAWDLSELWAKHPQVFNDFDHKEWGGGAGIAGRYYFWGQSVYGYYNGNDYWVHLKNIQLLTDAGVDILVMDATNTLIYPSQSKAVMMAIDAVRAQGKTPPKLIYYTNSSSGVTMQNIYNTFYNDGAAIRYPDTWFYLDGKPLILGLPEEAKGKDYEQFFTIRASQWPNERKKVDGWPWIEFKRPQKVYQNRKGEREIVNVSVAQHPNLGASMGGSAFHGATGNWGRSYRNGSPGDPKKDLVYGYNVQEQWDFALKQDVPFIFITGWNEWIAGKWRRPNDKQNEALFVDQANAEYSRDIEPSLTDGLQDHYYMQMVANIRRYKGVDETPDIGSRKIIKSLSDWTGISTEFKDYTGDTLHRNHKGAQSEPVVNYVNNTGRNDLDVMKVARDDKQIWFYVRTVAPITKPHGDNWMRLYLNTDRQQKIGWVGYNYRVIYGNQLQRYDGKKWVNTAKLTRVLKGNEMMIAIPLKALKLNDNLDLEFKWADNMQTEDPMDWYVNGDTAPGARFNFVAKAK